MADDDAPAPPPTLALELQQLISGEELGGRKLTQLLRHIKQLLHDKLGMSDDAISPLNELFLQRLPPYVQIVLTFADATMDLYKLVDIADSVMDIAMPSISAISDTPTDVLSIKQLLEEVMLYTDLFDYLPVTRSRHGSSSRS